MPPDNSVEASSQDQKTTDSPYRKGYTLDYSFSSVVSIDGFLETHSVPSTPNDPFSIESADYEAATPLCSASSSASDMRLTDEDPSNAPLASPVLPHATPPPEPEALDRPSCVPRYSPTRPLSTSKRPASSLLQQRVAPVWGEFGRLNGRRQLRRASGLRPRSLGKIRSSGEFSTLQHNLMRYPPPSTMPRSAT